MKGTTSSSYLREIHIEKEVFTCVLDPFIRLQSLVISLKKPTGTRNESPIFTVLDMETIEGGGETEESKT